MLPGYIKSEKIVDLNCINDLGFFWNKGSYSWQVQQPGFNTILRKFEELWDAIPKGSDQVNLWFYCKKGHHRSYAALLMFLPWLTHIHDHHFFQMQLNRRRTKVELWTYAELRRSGHRKWNNVPFADVLDDWISFLNWSDDDRHKLFA